MAGCFFYAIQSLCVGIALKHMGGCAGMPFWLHEPLLMLTIKGTPIRTRLITSMAIMVTFTLLWIIFFFIPQQKQLTCQKNEYELLSKQRVAFVSVVEHSDAITKQHQELVAIFDSLQQSSGSIQKTMSVLLQLMQCHEISCRGIEERGSKATAFYEKHYISMTGRGSFKQIIDFLHDVEVMRCPIKFKTLTMNKGKKLLKFQSLVRVINMQGGGDNDIV